MHIRNLAFISAAVLLVSCGPKAPKPRKAASRPDRGRPDRDKGDKNEYGHTYEPGERHRESPETFKVKFSTTKGDFTIEATRAWSPLGADRFYNLVKAGFFTDVAFFRVIEGFMVQFGIHGDPPWPPPGAGPASRTTPWWSPISPATSPTPWPARTPAPRRCSSTSAITPAWTAWASPLRQSERRDVGGEQPLLRLRRRRPRAAWAPTRAGCRPGAINTWKPTSQDGLYQERGAGSKGSSLNKDSRPRGSFVSTIWSSLRREPTNLVKNYVTTQVPFVVEAYSSTDSLVYSRRTANFRLKRSLRRYRVPE